MATKWEILEAKAADLERQAADIREGLAALDKVSISMGCSGCGLPLSTEGEFARHFRVPDVRYLNLGECPNQ